MADEEIVATPETPPANGAAADTEDPAKLKREKDEAFRLLRSRDNQVRQLSERVKEIDDLRAEINTLKQSRERAPKSESIAPLSDDGLPDINTDPTGWLKATREQDRQERIREQQQAALQNEQTTLNSFALSAEAVAKTQHPDYDKAMEFLRTDYRKELEDSGELHEAAFAALNDPNQKKNIDRYALEKGTTEVEAAVDMCAIGAWEWRRGQIVKAQRRSGGNPAVKAYEMAKRRGYKGEAGGVDGARSSTQVDASLAEMERKRNLRAAEQSLSDVRGGEPHDKRVWTRAELEDLMRSNPKEYRRAIAEIANQADSGDPRDVLGSIITR